MPTRIPKYELIFYKVSELKEDGFRQQLQEHASSGFQIVTTMEVESEKYLVLQRHMGFVDLEDI